MIFESEFYKLSMRSINNIMVTVINYTCMIWSLGSRMLLARPWTSVTNTLVSQENPKLFLPGTTTSLVGVASWISGSGGRGWEQASSSRSWERWAWRAASSDAIALFSPAS